MCTSEPGVWIATTDPGICSVSPLFFVQCIELGVLSRCLAMYSWQPRHATTEFCAYRGKTHVNIFETLILLSVNTNWYFPCFGKFLIMTYCVMIVHFLLNWFPYMAAA